MNKVFWLATTFADAVSAGFPSHPNRCACQQLDSAPPPPTEEGHEFMIKITKIAVLAVVVAVVLGSALLEYPVARADPKDDTYINLLQRDVGVTGPANDLIALGHAICDATNSGSPAHTDKNVLSRAAQLGLTQHKLYGVIVVANSQYCPQWGGYG
jgi:hypothetical protein